MQHARIANITGDVREENRWREVARYWTGRALLLKREMEQAAASSALIPTLLEHLDLAERRIRDANLRIATQRTLVSRLSNNRRRAADAIQALQLLQRELRDVEVRAGLIRSEIRKRTRKPEPL